MQTVTSACLQHTVVARDDLTLAVLGRSHGMPPSVPRARILNALAAASRVLARLAASTWIIYRSPAGIAVENHVLSLAWTWAWLYGPQWFFSNAVLLLGFWLDADSREAWALTTTSVSALPSSGRSLIGAAARLHVVRTAAGHYQ